MTLAHDLEASGWATRLQNSDTLEVYGVNLAEHYLLTLHQSAQFAFDILFIPSLTGPTAFKAS